MQFEDTTGRIAPSRYTSRIALTLTLLAPFALVADRAVADHNGPELCHDGDDSICGGIYV